MRISFPAPVNPWETLYLVVSGTVYVNWGIMQICNKSVNGTVEFEVKDINDNTDQ